MGACSTMDITREDAMTEIMSHLFHASDDEIAEVLYELVGHRRLYNFCIVSEYKEPDENGWPIQYSSGLLTR